MIELNSSIAAATRSDAFALITGLMMTKNQVTGIGNDDIERLYRYFLPAIPKKARTGEQWVAKAVSKQDVRFSLTFVHGADGKLCASDGHRMHWIESELTGFFDPKSMNPVSTGETFPNIERIIPKYRQDDFKRFDLADLEQKVITVEQKPLTIINVGGVWILREYLLSATNSKTAFDAVIPSTKNGALLVRSEFGLAVIMPINDK